MLKTKLEKFVAKRVLIFFIILAILDIVFMDKRWTILFGMFIGGIFSIFKFSSYSFIFSLIINVASVNIKKSTPVFKSTLIFVFNQIIVLPLLYISLKLDTWLFTGIVAGILLVPIVIFINCITEPLKITQNNFE